MTSFGEPNDDKYFNSESTKTNSKFATIPKQLRLSRQSNSTRPIPFSTYYFDQSSNDSYLIGSVQRNLFRPDSDIDVSLKEIRSE